MQMFRAARCAVLVVSLGRRAFWAGLAASLAVTVSGQAARVNVPPQTAPPAMGDPVNLYAPNVNAYAPPREDGEIHAQHVLGQVWVMTGEPGQSNVTVQVGAQGALVVDTGTQTTAAKLLTQIQRLAQEHGGNQKAIRRVVNTNGRADHIGGNDVVRKAGSQIIAAFFSNNTF